MTFEARESFLIYIGRFTYVLHLLFFKYSATGLANEQLLVSDLNASQNFELSTVFKLVHGLNSDHFRVF